VAIKILPEGFEEDPERVARFEREATLLASLHHTNIASIFGMHDADGVRFLAMELVPGEDLSQRIERGPLPLDDALDVARQIAEGLEAAHDNGVVHRDLKPANVKLTPDGKVKVLDLGLAKAWSHDPNSSSPADPALSPTLTSAGTRAGMILGTAAYMSPEQARGHAVDRRADIWALGCILYEMLTGRQLFEGETISDTLAAVLRAEISLDGLPAGTPAEVRRLLARCLDRDPRRRLRDAGELRVAAEYWTGGGDPAVSFEGSADHAETAGPSATSPPRSSKAWIAALAVVAILALLVATWGWLRPRSIDQRRPARFEVRAHSEDAWSLIPTSIDVSPDGRRVAWSVTDGLTRRIVVREIDSLEVRDLPDTEGTDRLAFSLDGNSIAFFAQGKLRRIDLAGRRAVDLCDAVEGAGIAWAPDGTIVFNESWIRGLSRVSADGGTPTAVTELNIEKGEYGHWFPEVLPDGKHVMFTIWRTGLDDISVAVAPLDGGEVRDILPRASYAHYLETGHLVFARAGGLWIAPFDLDGLQVTGDAVEVLEGVDQRWDNGEGPYSVSRNGVLAYVPGGLWDTKRRVIRMARDGTAEPLDVEPQPYLSVAVSPDGERLALAVFESGRVNLLVHELSRGIDTRITSGVLNTWPVWSPDGSEIVFTTSRNGPWDVYRVASDGASQPVPVAKDLPDQVGVAWSPDGRFIVWQEGYHSMRALDLESGEPARTLEFPHAAPSVVSFSPDGAWIAYDTVISGRNEVFIQRFPSGGRAYQVSIGGGQYPLWSADGRTIFYRRGDSVHAASLRRDRGEPSVGRPTELFQADIDLRHDNRLVWSYDAGSDSLVMIERGDYEKSRARFIVAVNWDVEVAQRLAAAE
jgi:serine/threonine-protein kinase